MQQSFDTPGPTSLYVEIGSGDVQIRADDTAETTVEVTGEDAEDATVEMRGEQIVVLGPHRRGGFLGRHFGSLPLFPLPFTTRGVILAEAFVAMPFLVITVEAGLRQMNQRYEEAAATLGAGPWRRFWTVTVPLIAPSLAAGAALSWARALGEFGATITFAGNLPGRTQTMPSAIYVTLESRPEGAIALSLILLAVSLAVLVALRGRLLGADEPSR